MRAWNEQSQRGGQWTKKGAIGEEKELIKAEEVDIAAADSNRQYKEMQLQGDERETQQAYFISPGDMKQTVITGLVLSSINLSCFTKRWKTKEGGGRQKNRNTHIHTHQEP